MEKVKELKERPLPELLKYEAKQLRHAASYIDRDEGKHPILNLISVFKKIKDLGAELHLFNDETGHITFDYNGKEIYRDFNSGAELSLALALGPIDLYSKIFYKNGGNVYPCEISVDNIETKNSIVIYVEDLDLHRMIHMNGAEKILSNTKEGFTIGQLKLKENRKLNDR